MYSPIHDFNILTACQIMIWQKTILCLVLRRQQLNVSLKKMNPWENPVHALCFQTVSVTEQCTVHFPNLQNSVMQKCTAAIINR